MVQTRKCNKYAKGYCDGYARKVCRKERKEGKKTNGEGTKEKEQ